MSSASDNRSLPSLLPYLQETQSYPGLKLTLIRQVTPSGDTPYPFVVLDDSSPVSRSIEASFSTDAGSLLKKVLFHIQKDQYALTSDDLRPVTNLDIDAAWQKAFQGNTSCNDLSGVVLSAQTDERGRLAQLSPLFYCQERYRFFHPVCPACGNSLSLCRDDELLKRTGYSPYSTSLKRYLYCEHCASLRVSEFYVSERDHTDPITIKDRWSLIDQFRLVDQIRDPNGDFPCVNCPEREACYGPDPLVRSRIIPFSFYPFFLILSDAPSLHLMDFTHLVSGATIDEVLSCVEQRINPGRINSLRELRNSGFIGEYFFSKDDERSFLEILFLKLSMLGNILRLRLEQRPDLAQTRLKSDRIWVRIPGINHLLPSFWNFTIEILNDIDPVSSRVLLPALSSDTFTYLGFLWFQVLLQNRRIIQNDVLKAVTEYLSPQGDDSVTVSGRPKSLKVIFVPENNYWNPENAPVRSEWSSFWERAGALGYLLLDASKQNDSNLLGNEVVHSLEELLSDIKAALFHALPGRERIAPHEGPAVEQVLQGILLRLLEKTRREAPLAAGPDSSDEYDDETVETVILSPSPAQEQIVPSSVLVETYVGPRSSSPSGTTEEPTSEFADEPLLETVLLVSPRTGQHPQQVPAEKSSGHLPQEMEAGAEVDQLSETIVIMPQSGRLRPRFPRD